MVVKHTFGYMFTHFYVCVCVCARVCTDMRIFTDILKRNSNTLEDCGVITSEILSDFTRRSETNLILLF